jgi:hypothetical protein
VTILHRTAILIPVAVRARLSLSPQVDQFVLKGGMLLAAPSR